MTSDRGYTDPSRRFASRETWNGAAVVRVPATGFGRESRTGRMFDYLTFLAGALVRMLSGPRPHVVVGLSTPPLLGAFAVRTARLRGARAVYWVMDVNPDIAFALGFISPEGVLGRVLSLMSKWTLGASDVVIALGETMADRLRRQGARHVVVVCNWADGEAIRPMERNASSLRKDRGWDGKFIVLYSGNMGLAHEFDTVLEAAARLQARRDVTFAFVGDGPRRKEIERGAAARGLSNVEFCPGVARPLLGDSLAAGDVHLVTLRPGMPGLLVPSKIYGILAAGRPAIYVGPSEGEVYDIVRSGCGSAVASGDVDALIRAIASYRNDPERLTREGLAARTLFESRFTKAGQAQTFLRELQAAAGRSSAEA